MAVKTKAQILSEIASLLADNSTGDISANDVRTVVNDITDSYEDLITAGTTSQYWRGDKSWQTLPILEATGSLTSDQINALDTTPIQLIAAPGANKYIIIENSAFHYKAGSNAFTLSGGNILLYYGSTTAISYTVPASILGGTTSYIYSNLPPYPVTASIVQPAQLPTSVINQAINIELKDNTISGGDGTINYSIKYRIVTTS